MTTTELSSMVRLYVTESLPPHTGQDSCSLMVAEREYLISKANRPFWMPMRLMRSGEVPLESPLSDSFLATAAWRALSDS